ncbi:hypothetical protein L917_21286 [Phytophthora nicotianae]|uniref:Uncharacterized protein n=1 Tax=Phytophthora nicotianae TaxID=4792 RepID=W2JZR1_PHYNI|nr:hypothetical protein L917_21286 [Phytophthora nicotianae]
MEMKRMQVFIWWEYFDGRALESQHISIGYGHLCQSGTREGHTVVASDACLSGLPDELQRVGDGDDGLPPASMAKRRR